MPERPPPLELRCFGPPTVRVAGHEPPPDVLWRKNLALLVYLALSPERTRSREHLLGLFWPEKEEAKARHSLNEAVRRLRAGLGAGRVVSRSDAVSLNGERLMVDALGDEPPTEEFLDGLVIPDAPDFEQWMSLERTRFRDRAVAALLERAETALVARNFRAAAESASRMLALDPVREDAVRLRMTSYALQGDASAALQAYRDFERRLADELGETPSREIQALAQRIRTERWRAAPDRDDQLPVPLVGREEIHAAAFGEAVRALRAGPRVLAVSGRTGMGKSRLLAECGDRWRLDGGITCAARPVAGDRECDWSALREFMRGGLLDAPGLAATDPEALRTLAAVVPRLAERFPPAVAPSRADVAGAFGDLLRAVADEAPVALLLDDAHLTDDATVAVLKATLENAKDLPVLLALGVRDDAAAAPPALTVLLAEIGRGVPGAAVRLDPLREREILALVGALAPWCDTLAQRDRLARRIAFETGGDPLFAVTLLQGLAEVATLREEALVWPPPNITLEAPVPFEVPHLVRVVLLARLEQLDPFAREVLVAACLGDRAIEPELIAELLDRPRREVEDALVTLERRRFVQFDGDRYLLEAQMVAHVVLRDLVTPGQRKRLRERYAALAGAARA